MDIHVAHLHDLVGIDNAGSHTDSIRLIPGSKSAIELVPDTAGKWLFHCHVNDHIFAGMQAIVHVQPGKISEPNLPRNRRQRVYYVQAEDVLWDYTPKGTNICDNSEFGADERIFTEANIPITASGKTLGYTIGSTYLKTQYIEYTDATFKTKVERDEDTAHLGIMGPVIRARVGEEIVVRFRNAGAYPVSMHPHGLQYDKASEGALYNDGSPASMKKDDMVQPGQTYTYRWNVLERAGPGPKESKDVKMWMYHSHRNEIIDTYAGLFGVILVIGNTAKYDDKTLLPLDGHKEVFIHMSVMNELQSFHIRDNVKRVAKNGDLTDSQIDTLLENEQFKESNLMHAINGYLYCNGPILKLQSARPTRFYFYSLGTEGMYTFLGLSHTNFCFWHFKGNNF